MYVEKQDNDKTACHYSKHRVVIKKYFESVFKIGSQEVDDFSDIVNLHAKERFLINNQEIGYQNRNDIIRRAVKSDFDISSRHYDVRSILF